MSVADDGSFAGSLSVTVVVVLARRFIPRSAATYARSMNA